MPRAMAVHYDEDGRALAASGRSGPESARDRPVDQEIFTGELGCGELLMELKMQLERVGPGGLVRIVTDDPAAHTELPAWCRMTGHRLVEADAPFYILETLKTP